MTRVGAVHGALGPGGGGLRGGGGRGDDGAQAHRQALLHLQVGARIELQTKVHTKIRNPGSWLKADTTAFTFKTLLRHYAKRVFTPRSLNVKLGPRRKDHKGQAVWLA